MKANDYVRLGLVVCFFSFHAFAEQVSLPQVSGDSKAQPVPAAKESALDSLPEPSVKPLPARVAPVSLCRPQIEALFARLSSEVSLSSIKSQEDAALAVSRIFTARFDLCELGAYEEFLNQFSEVASSVLRPSSAKEQMPRYFICLALLNQLPKRVSFEEGTSSKLFLQQMRANLHAVSEDVRQTRSKKVNLAVIEKLLQAVDAVSPPDVEKAPPPIDHGNVVMIKLPTRPLPAWAVLSLLSLKSMRTSADPLLVKTAREKIQPVLDWIENPSLSPSVSNTASVHVPQSLMPEAVVKDIYELGETLKRYEMWHQSPAKAAKEAQQKEWEDACQKIDSISKWLESSD